MIPFAELPESLFAEPSTLRILRIDDQWRFLTLMAKAHGTRPDSRKDLVMDGFALNYVLRGQGVYREENGRTHMLTPGTMFQRLPDRRHSTLIDPASDYAEFFLVLDRATALQLQALGLIMDAEVLMVGRQPEVIEAFCALRRDMLRPEAELPTRAALTCLLDFLHRLYDLAQRGDVGNGWENVIRQACVLLESDLDEKLDLTEVAQRLGVAYPTFRRRFREAMQVSPGAYRVRCRLEQARYLLLEKPVKQVADEMGYSDPFTFSAQFKSCFGLSPRRFQAQQALTATSRRSPSD